MKVKKVYFLKSAPRTSDFPVFSHPEFAFMGRSNVGKSSLINMVTERHDLVKVGSKPGVTRLVNFFILNDRISLADLPGYGYAKVAMEVKKGFLPLIRNYIDKRENLKLAFLLIDIRRTPGDLEKEMISRLSERGVHVAIVVTRSDKVSRNERNKSVARIAAELEIDPGSVFISSSKTGEGKKEIQALISEYSAS